MPYTHSLVYRLQEPFEFQEYMTKRPILLGASPTHQRTSSPTSDSSESEWAGIDHSDDEPDINSVEMQEILDDPEADEEDD
ncbi:hypothetical protein K438DRAFT_1971912 [Mycena galopus ATCC 62051]|nr:hypothetical protein K438DRAFT_1975513 [Mycena galopus ATCC 62051]KAF8189273.1 hypothetical protein K438DRAFT_1971912 [Mycena galopus ATCC 62051]